MKERKFKDTFLPLTQLTTLVRDLTAQVQDIEGRLRRLEHSKEGDNESDDPCGSMMNPLQKEEK